MTIKIPFETNFEVLKKDQDVTTGKFFVEGYVATTDMDLQGHEITAEAIEMAKDDLLKNSTVLLNHDQNRPIGKVVGTNFDKRGLYVRIEISESEPKIRAKIAEGVLNKFSIRGKVLNADTVYDQETGLLKRIIKSMYLTETSMVSVPANPEAESMRWWISKSMLHEIVKSLNYHDKQKKEDEVLKPKELQSEVSKVADHLMSKITDKALAGPVARLKELALAPIDPAAQFAKADGDPPAATPVADPPAPATPAPAPADPAPEPTPAPVPAPEPEKPADPPAAPEPKAVAPAPAPVVAPPAPVVAPAPAPAPVAVAPAPVVAPVAAVAPPAPATPAPTVTPKADDPGKLAERIKALEEKGDPAKTRKGIVGGDPAGGVEEFRKKPPMNRVRALVPTIMGHEE